MENDLGGEPMIPLAIVLTCAVSAMNGFSVVQKDGRYWLRSPSNMDFLSYGVCCVNRGTKPQDKNPLNPSYCAQDHYKTDQDWSSAAINRLRAWGFNTVGSWSDHELLRNTNLYQTPVLHLSATGIPWVDPWDAEVEKAVMAQAKSMIDGWKSDPNVIGYFSDNELGWWLGAIFEWAFKYKPQSAGRAVFVDKLRSYYTSWEKVCRDFEAEDASSFDDLLLKGRLYLKPGSDGVAFARIWLRTVADRYYELCRKAIHEADNKALYLGDRYISNYYPEVASASAKYVDIVSTNLNADWDNGTLAPFYLDYLYDLTKKPILITEFYAAAMENQSGNTNDSSGFPTVRTQKDRAKSFSRQVQQAMSRPYVVGMHWFQYYDEGTFGRDDGENYNMGLVDIHDQPYDLLTRQTKKLFARRPKTVQTATPQQPDIPYIHPSDASSLINWDIKKACLPHSGKDRRGDAFVSWNETGLYVALYWYEDRFFEAFYKNSDVPRVDYAQSAIDIGNCHFHLTMNGSSQAQLDKGIVLKYQPGDGSNGNTRNTVIVRLPAKEFSRIRLLKGEEFPISISLITRGKAYTMHWDTKIATGGSR